MIALVLLAGAAHAQSSNSYNRGATVEQSQVLQPPPTRAIGYQSERTEIENGTPVQPASHTAAVGHDEGYEPLLLRKSANSQRLMPESEKRISGSGTTTTVLGSLSIVLAAFFVLVWLSRKTAPKGLAPLPSEVFEPLGRAALTARQQMQLIRLGNKLVLLCVTSTGVETITEVTDQDEVGRLAALCQQGRSGSISDTFRQVLSQYADEPAPEGFVGDPSLSQADLANRATRRERRRENDRG